LKDKPDAEKESEEYTNESLSSGKDKDKDRVLITGDDILIEYVDRLMKEL
jgi:hypothetical protein